MRTCRRGAAGEITNGRFAGTTQHRALYVNEPGTGPGSSHRNERDAQSRDRCRLNQKKQGPPLIGHAFTKTQVGGLQM